MEFSVHLSKQDDGTYLAVTPAVPECISCGKTPKEAMDNHRANLRPYLAETCDQLPDCIELRVIDDDLRKLLPRSPSPVR